MLFGGVDVVGGSRLMLSIIDALSHSPRYPDEAEIHVGAACTSCQF